jgi:hypothetical protein
MTTHDELLEFLNELSAFRLGTIGVYEFQKKETGRWGFFGFLLALIGAGLLIGHDVDNAFVFLYPLGASLFALGISVLAIRSWTAKALPRWALALSEPVLQSGCNQ